MELGKIWWDTCEREFSADSEYRIRFFIACTVLEILDDLWTSFLPFWPKMPTLWMNISRTRFFQEMRFSQGVQKHLVLSIPAKKTWDRMDRFPAKVQKVLKNAHFCTLWMNQIFFFENRASSLFYIYHWVTWCKKIRKI